MIHTSAQASFFDIPSQTDIRLRSGATFKPETEHWKFVDGIYTVYMNFQELPPAVQFLLPYLKLVLANFLEVNSPTYAVNMYRIFIRLADVISDAGPLAVECVTEAHILQYIAGNRQTFGDSSQLSALISRWKELGLPGISEDAVKHLRSIKKKGNRKGHAVLTLDPVNGPFTDLEVQQLCQALNLAYGELKIEPDLYFLTWLGILTGQRVSQYCALKVCDLVRKELSDGIFSYEILIPKAKQRGSSIRDDFLTRPLLRQFGDEFYRYAQDISSQFRDLGNAAPMFPTHVKSAVLQVNDSFSDHWTPSALSTYYSSALASIAPLSVRTSAPLNIVIGRFRDTLGTRAAQEGFGELVIAEILGHVDTQNVKCYVAVIPEIAERLDRKLTRYLAPIAKAFVGKVLLRRSDATRFDDSSSEIIDYRNSGEIVGNCGTTYNCRFHAPIACYTCPKFEAWIDAPHAELYQQLENEREEIANVSSTRLAAINDLTMLAIKNVIDECARLKSGTSEIING